LREQIIRIGRRTAKERVAHLLLELNRRIAAIEGTLTDFDSRYLHLEKLKLAS